MAKNKLCNYDTLMKTIESIQQEVVSLKESVAQIREAYNNDGEETCPDVAASEQALVEAIEGMCLDMLLTEEAKGDA